MDSPLPTENPTPAVLISNLFARNVCDMPNSFAAQKHRRLFALTFLSCRPFEKTSSGSISKTSATIPAIRSRSKPCLLSLCLRSYCSSNCEITDHNACADG